MNSKELNRLKLNLTIIIMTIVKEYENPEGSYATKGGLTLEENEK